MKIKSLGFIDGTVTTLFNSHRTATEVMDLVPLKPIGEGEETIRNIYRTKSKELYAKLKG
jgi:pyrroline-5-carboxylate reductase